jgi:hypothetical protein
MVREGALFTGVETGEVGAFKVSSLVKAKTGGDP